MDQYWYVDERHQILSGEEAKRHLERVSDSIFLTDSQGIVSIPHDRWLRAQTFERIGWMEKWRASIDDRNVGHYVDFDRYRTLSGLRFNHAIEIGCGPFTNLRLIGRVCRIRECTLLDPLIKDYLEHPHCAYDESALRCEVPRYLIGAPNSLAVRALRRVHRALSVVGGGRIKIHSILDTPVEEARLPYRCDLIVIVNVLEHCYDVNLVFKSILELAAPGAILVYHDKCYDHRQVEAMVRGHYYEAGHPLMVDRMLIEAFLEKHFDPLFSRRAVKPLSIPGFSEYEGLFFIGRLKGTPD